MKYTISIFLSIFLISVSIAQNTNRRETISPEVLNRVIQFSQSQLKKTVASFNDSILYPRSTDSTGNWVVAKPPDWTIGFFPGCLWYASGLTNDTLLRNDAIRWTEGLTAQQFLTKTHDIGFIMFNSFGKGFQFQSKEEYKPILIQSAQSLMSRYNPTVGCIKSWDGRKWPYPVIIDNMMNLELLLWASKNGGTKEMYDAAVSHATKTMNNHFREDGSTYHVLDYDTLTGNVIAKVTHQGYADESVWARGQAWAIYGFTMLYRETKDEQFLTTAEKAANWFIENLPSDFVPYWDFRSPKTPNDLRDASAAAIAASALFELSMFEKNSTNSLKYYNSAVQILTSLCSSPYIADGTPSQGLLNHSVGNYPKNSEMDVSIIYADYYFLEAIQRYSNLNLKSESTH